MSDLQWNLVPQNRSSVVQATFCTFRSWSGDIAIYLRVSKIVCVYNFNIAIFKAFFRIYMASYEYKGGWKNSRQLYKPETQSMVYISFENFQHVLSCLLARFSNFQHFAELVDVIT